MADIRINALATTAASTASDDFIAVDGSANGTRKLNAYSPTFGGNLTVSGTSIAVGTALTTGRQSILGGTWIPNAAASAVGVELNSAITPNANQAGIGLYVNPSFTEASSGTHSIIAGTYLGSFAVTDAAGATTEASTLYVAGAPTGAGTNKYALHVAGGNSLLDGNLTVSGTGTSTFSGPVTLSNTASTASYQTGLRLSSTVASAPNTVQSLEFYSSSLGVALAAVDALRESGSYASSLRFWSTTGPGTLTEGARLTSNGNFLIGGTIDGGQKLQVSGDATFAGSVGIGTTSPQYSLQVSSTNTASYYPLALSSGVIGTIGNTVGMRFGYTGNTYQKGAIIFESTSNNAVGKLHFALNAAENASNVTLSDSKFVLTSSGDAKFAGSVYAEKSGAGIAGQSTGSITQFTTVNSTTYSVTTAAAKVFVVQLGSGDAALCYASYKSSTITILGSDGTIVNSSSPTSTQLGIYKSANDHVISFKTGSNALAGAYGSWGFCFLGNPVISIA